MLSDRKKKKADYYISDSAHVERNKKKVGAAQMIIKELN